MEWVETTGKSVEEAKDLALDQLGVDHQDAEFEVIEEPKTGLFGRVRGEARVRARIAPKSPRPKNERRRGGRSKGGGEARSNQREGQRSNGRSEQRDGQEAGGSQGSRSKSQSDSPKRESKPREERPPMDADEQCKAATEFLSGLVTSFGLTGEVTANLDEDDFLNVGVQGEGLGLLIGPGLNTLDALQELTRNAVQRQADGRDYGRVVVDVDGVRARRRAALEQFVTDAAKKVVETGDTVVFEVMSSADRKVVHDTVGELDGVVSGSEGEDPRRRVVLKPA